MGLDPFSGKRTVICLLPVHSGSELKIDHIHHPGLPHSEHSLGFSFGRQTCRKMGRRLETLVRSSLRACSVLRSTTGLTRLELFFLLVCSVAQWPPVFLFWGKGSPLNSSNKEGSPFFPWPLAVACAVAMCWFGLCRSLLFAVVCLLGACCLKWVVFVVIFASCSLLSLFGAFFQCWFVVDCRVGC